MNFTPSFADPKKHKLRRWATYASVGVALTLIGAKGGAFLLSGSVSLLSSLLDSIVDAMASGVVLFGVLHAQRPPDHCHRFGHGKAEALAALAQSVFLVVSAGVLGWVAIERILAPEPLTHGTLAIGIMGLSIILTLGLVAFQRHVIRATGSLAVGADHVHYTGDLLINVGVIAVLGLSLFWEWPYADPLFGLAVAGYLAVGAVKIINQTLAVLMDQELSQENRDTIARLARQHPQVRDIHDIRTRSGGDRVFIEFHLELDPQLTLERAHTIAHEVEDALRVAFPEAEIGIHQEPAGIQDDRLDARVAGQGD